MRMATPSNEHGHEVGIEAQGSPGHVGDRLDGIWRVERIAGLLPPLVGMRKRIEGDRGRTTIGPILGVGFDVVGLELRYRRPLRGLIDSLEPERPGAFKGRTTFLGRQLGTFRMIRV